MASGTCRSTITLIETRFNFQYEKKIKLLHSSGVDESTATVEPLSSCILDISQSIESENRPVYYEVKWKTNLCVDSQYRIRQMMKFHNCHFSERHFKHHVYIIESLDYIKTPYVNTIHLNKTRI